MPKSPRIISPVSIVGLDEKGRATATWEHEGKTERIYTQPRRVAPGETWEFLYFGRRKGEAEGQAQQILGPENPKVRTSPACRHFGDCGGCSLQHWNYEAQAGAKQGILDEVFGEHAQAMLPFMRADEHFHYRNKMEFSASSQGYLPPGELGSRERPASIGLFAAHGTRLVLDLAECRLFHPSASAILAWFRSLMQDFPQPYYNDRTHTGSLRTILMRSNRAGELLVMPIFSENARGSMDEILAKLGQLPKEFPEIVSLYYLINPRLNDSYFGLDTHHVWGETRLVETLDGLKFGSGPCTFFQVHVSQAEKLFRRIVELARLERNQSVWDLYCGIGTISLYCARQSGSVLGVEIEPSSVESARAAAEANGITNAEFLCGDMKDILSGDFLARRGTPDVVICDPPRAGLHPDVARLLARSGASRIVYVSCKASSLRRDLEILGAHYRVAALQGCDLMPHTIHIETIALLERKDAQ